LDCSTNKKIITNHLEFFLSSFLLPPTKLQLKACTNTTEIQAGRAAPWRGGDGGG
jgi:hypothetical protein